MKGSVMKRETYEHIRDNIHLLDIDVENGIILNRNKTDIGNHGYLRVSLKCKRLLQHQIFAVALWGEKCVGMTVNHKNEVKTDNRSCNLELMTTDENNAARTKGAHVLTSPVIAINIDTWEETYFKSQQDASRVLGLQQGNIYSVINGKRNRAGRYYFKRAV